MYILQQLPIFIAFAIAANDEDRPTTTVINIGKQEMAKMAVKSQGNCHRDFMVTRPQRLGGNYIIWSPKIYLHYLNISEILGIYLESLIDRLKVIQA